MTKRFLTITLALITLITILGAFGCTPAATVRPPRPGPTGPLPDAAQALQRYQKFDADLTGARGSCSAVLRSPGGEYDFTQAFLIKLPGKMRMEVFTFMGITISYMATSNGSFSVYLPGENKFIRGQTESSSMANMAMPIFLNLSQLLELLLGRIPISEHERAELTYDDSANQYRVETFSSFGETVQVLFLDPTDYYLLGTEIFEGGVLVATIELFDRDLSGNFKPAKKIEARFPLSRTFLRLIVDDLEPNPEIDEELFTLKPPPGVEIIEN
jgi:outer membrane lipoprotein-sorting protein